MDLTYLLPLIARDSGMVAMLIGYLLMNPSVLTRWKEYIVSWLFKEPAVKKKCFHNRYTANSVYATTTTEFISLYHLITTHLDTNNIPYTLDYVTRDYSKLIVRNLVIDDYLINTYSKTEETKANDGAVVKTYILTIEISTSTVSNHQFNHFLEKQNDIYQEYKKKLRMQKRGKQMFVLSKIPVRFSVYPHETFKTFDNLFFEGKRKFIQHLDDFMNNESRYDRLGVPYSLGIMLHGIPGSGKTSIIKAISNYCKRQVFIIPTKKMKTIDDLTQVFNQPYIEQIDEYIDTKDRLYVFEEIDCGHWEDVVKSRDLTHSHLCEKGAHSANELKKKESVEHVVSIEEKKEEKKLTLGEFLEFLDGMLEMRNRMIVFTTNQIETIDPAILRPGRVDIILELNRLTKQDVQSFYNLWFQEPIPCHIVKDMTDYKFTQAEIGALFGRGHERTYIHSMLTDSCESDPFLVSK